MCNKLRGPSSNRLREQLLLPPAPAQTHSGQHTLKVRRRDTSGISRQNWSSRLIGPGWKAPSNDNPLRIPGTSVVYNSAIMLQCEARPEQSVKIDLNIRKSSTISSLGQNKVDIKWRSAQAAKSPLTLCPS